MKPHILFADDEAPMRELLSEFFRQKGYEVTTAPSAQGAMRTADQGRYDLAILDINLAGENGLELLGYFRTNFPKLPVVMFTGLPGGDELLDQAMARGASGFMRKTDSLDDLLAAVQVYLPKV
jgi:DNA-binding response OmpR family regulator